MNNEIAYSLRVQHKVGGRASNAFAISGVLLGHKWYESPELEYSDWGKT
jgi:hypothetical protein